MIPHKKRFKKEKIPGKKALARGVAFLGVKVTGIEPPRLTFVTVYRLPIRLPAKVSADLAGSLIGSL